MTHKILIALLSIPLLAGCALREGRIADCAEAIDPAIKRELAEQACSGNKVAQFMLGYVYETGEGTGVDSKKAVKWYHRASRPTRGMTHVYAAPVGKDRYGRVETLQTSSEVPGNPEAEYRLGLMYLEGRGVEANRDKAIRWLRRAAEKGHGLAEAALEDLEAGTT